MWVSDVGLDVYRLGYEMGAEKSEWGICIVVSASKEDRQKLVVSLIAGLEASLLYSFNISCCNIIFGKKYTMKQ